MTLCFYRGKWDKTERLETYFIVNSHIPYLQIHSKIRLSKQFLPGWIFPMFAMVLTFTIEIHIVPPNRWSSLKNLVHHFGGLLHKFFFWKFTLWPPMYHIFRLFFETFESFWSPWDLLVSKNWPQNDQQRTMKEKVTF